MCSPFGRGKPKYINGYLTKELTLKSIEQADVFLSQRENNVQHNSLVSGRNFWAYTGKLFTNLEKCFSECSNITKEFSSSLPIVWGK
jgi:hypothetical protein